jgi:hypothetical protein
MGREKRMRLIVGLSVAALLPAAHAHHGFGTFDRNNEVSVRGTITGVDFVNPHAYVYFEVRGEHGTAAPWRCELRSATTLRRSGWSAEMFVRGEPIAITGARDRNDPASCYVSTAVFADGTTADRYAQLTRPTAVPAAVAARPLRRATGEPNISGDWAPEQLVMTDSAGRGGNLVPLSRVEEFRPGEGRGTDPAVPEPRSATPAAGADANFRQYRTRAVELTPLGKQAADGFDVYSSENPRMRCETTSILFDWTYDGAINRITQSADAVVLEYGQLGFTRTIHLNVSEHPANIAPSRAGHSIGRWEGDVLVVDTVGFSPGVLSPPVMHSGELHVVERFSLDPVTLTLTRSYVAEDGLHFTGRYEGSDSLEVADLPYAPDACKELWLGAAGEAR